MIPSIDYLTLVIAGAFLFWTGMEGEKPKRLDVLIATIGIVLFLVGTIRAFMGALGW